MPRSPPAEHELQPFQRPINSIRRWIEASDMRREETLSFSRCQQQPSDHGSLTGTGAGGWDVVIVAANIRPMVSERYAFTRDPRNLWQMTSV